MSKVLVQLRMKSEANGGRHSAFTQGYSPHFVVKGTNEWLAVRSIEHQGQIAPGAAEHVRFELMYYPKINYGALTVGAEFEVMEGARSVATGTVLEREDN